VLSEITRRRGDVRLRYQIIGIEPFLSWEQLEALSIDLDISKWELRSEARVIQMPDERPRRTINNIKLDFDQPSASMSKGIRRAYAFMTLGLHAARDKSITDLRLDSHFQIRFLPEKLTAEQIADTQHHFALWITGNGLRELDQFFSKALDKLHFFLTIADYRGARVDSAFGKRLKAMRADTNLASKLDRLKEEFGITAKHRDSIASLSQARNALTHNLGIVSTRYSFGKEALNVTWLGFDILVGDKVINRDFEEFTTEKEEAVALKIVERKKAFLVDTPVELSPFELSEICMTFHMQMDELIQQARGYTKAKGIPELAAPAPAETK
jgi:hypothetical protein